MTLQSIFRGPRGFRAGWRFLLFCGLLVAFQMIANLALDVAVTRSHIAVPPWPNAVVFIVQDSVTLAANFGLGPSFPAIALMFIVFYRMYGRSPAKVG